MRYVLFCLTVFVFLPASVFAASLTADSEFTIDLRVGDDNFPPTTPSPLVVDYVTTSQIQISWGASTDDLQLKGYQVFRDAVQIATTTLTSYSDTGLTSSTTYEYFVRAYDGTGKISSSSNAVSTTTLAGPVIPGNGEGSTASEIELVSLSLEPDFTTALISWETDRFARYILQWGETLSYELGFVSNQEYKKMHQTMITDLEPNTTYEYRIVAYNARDDRSILVRDSFKTPALPDTTPPPNVSALLATSEKNDVLLSWRNPSFDFSYVRIVRSPLFYPVDPFDGYVVYEGSGESLRDRWVLRDRDIQYYTVFVYDEAGNRSSGAIAWVRKWPDDVGGGGNSASVIQSTLDEDIGEPEPVEPVEITDTTPLSISFDDIVILQDDQVIESVSDTYLVDTTKPFTISAPYDLFPEHLKAIRVTLSHPVDSSITYSFLLRVNADKTAYEALITDLGFSGTIPVKLSVYDFETNEQATADASIISHNVEPVVEVVKNVGSGIRELWWLPLVLVALTIWWLFGKRRKEDEDKQPVRYN